VKRYALRWLGLQIPSVTAVFAAVYKSGGGSGEIPTVHDLARLPPELLASVVGWGLLAGFLVRVWKEIEDDAVKTTAAKLRAMPSYAANLFGRLWDVCRGSLVARSPGFERIYRKRVHEKYGIFNDRGLGLINANRLHLEKVYVELSIHSDVTFKTPPVDPLRRPVEGREPVWRFLRELRPGYALVRAGQRQDHPAPPPPHVCARTPVTFPRLPARAGIPGISLAGRAHHGEPRLFPNRRVPRPDQSPLRRS
jgi:hypothetical protein